MTRDEQLAAHLRGMRHLLDWLSHPSTKTSMSELIDKSLRIIERPDVEKERLAILLTAIVKSTKNIDTDLSVVRDRRLFEDALTEARKLLQ